MVLDLNLKPDLSSPNCDDLSVSVNTLDSPNVHAISPPPPPHLAPKEIFKPAKPNKFPHFFTQNSKIKSSQAQQQQQQVPDVFLIEFPYVSPIDKNRNLAFSPKSEFEALISRTGPESSKALGISRAANERSGSGSGSEEDVKGASRFLGSLGLELKNVGMKELKSHSGSDFVCDGETGSVDSAVVVSKVSEDWAQRNLCVGDKILEINSQLCTDKTKEEIEALLQRTLLTPAETPHTLKIQHIKSQNALDSSEFAPKVAAGPKDDFSVKQRVRPYKGSSSYFNKFGTLNKIRSKLFLTATKDTNEKNDKKDTKEEAKENGKESENGTNKGNSNESDKQDKVENNEKSGGDGNDKEKDQDKADKGENGAGEGDQEEEDPDLADLSQESEEEEEEEVVQTSVFDKPRAQYYDVLDRTIKVGKRDIAIDRKLAKRGLIPKHADGGWKWRPAKFISEESRKDGKGYIWRLEYIDLDQIKKEIANDKETEAKKEKEKQNVEALESKDENAKPMTEIKGNGVSIDVGDESATDIKKMREATMSVNKIKPEAKEVIINVPDDDQFIADYESKTKAPLQHDFEVESKLDVLDIFKSKKSGRLLQKWRAAVVTVVEPYWIRVHYNGWGSVWDEWINVAMQMNRLAKYAKMSQKAARMNRRRVENFKKVLARKKNLQLVDMLPDGNCLFRTVAHQVYGTPKKHKKVREECCNYMLKNKSRFAMVVGDVNRHAARMRRNREWGDDPEIRAMEELYDRRMEIYAVTGNGTNVTPMKIHFDGDLPDDLTDDPIRLSYHGQCHYNSIIPLGIKLKKDTSFNIKKSGLKITPKQPQHSYLPSRKSKRPPPIGKIKQHREKMLSEAAEAEEKRRQENAEKDRLEKIQKKVERDADEEKADDEEERDGDTENGEMDHSESNINGENADLSEIGGEAEQQNSEEGEQLIDADKENDKPKENGEVERVENHVKVNGEAKKVNGENGVEGEVTKEDNNIKHKSHNVAEAVIKQKLKDARKELNVSL